MKYVLVVSLVFLLVLVNVFQFVLLWPNYVVEYGAEEFYKGAYMFCFISTEGDTKTCNILVKELRSWNAHLEEEIPEWE